MQTWVDRTDSSLNKVNITAILVAHMYIHFAISVQFVLNGLLSWLQEHDDNAASM